MVEPQLSQLGRWKGVPLCHGDTVGLTQMAHLARSGAGPAFGWGEKPAGACERFREADPGWAGGLDQREAGSARRISRSTHEA